MRFFNKVEQWFAYDEDRKFLLMFIIDAIVIAILLVLGFEVK